MTLATTPEAELLFLCARRELAGNSKVRLKELCSEKIDWLLLERAAKNHKLSALLYHHLKQTCWELVPAEAALSLRNAFITRARLQWRMTDELVELCNSLDLQNVKHVTIKGPSLAEPVYGALELREFDDLDILVPRTQVAKAIDTLLSQGFRPFPWRNTRHIPVEFMCAGRFLDFASEYSFKNERTGTIVDLHWQLLPSAFLFIDEIRLLETTTTVQVNGASLRTLREEMLLLFLCAHAAKHAWSKIGWITDVAEMISAMAASHSTDWAKLVALAKDTHTKKMLLLGCDLSAKIGAVTLSPTIQEELSRSPEISRLAQEFIDHFRSNPCSPQWRKRKTWRVYLTLMDNISAKFNLIYGNCFQPTLDEWTLIPLPPGLSGLYHLLRPASLLAESITARGVEH